MMIPLGETLVSKLYSLCECRDKGITFIDSSQGGTFLSYADLQKQSLYALGNLQSLGIQKGDELVFYVEDNRQFLILFWACLLGGIIPVPLSIGTQDEHKAKVFQVWKTLKNPAIVSDTQNFGRLYAFAAEHSLLSFHVEMERRSIHLTAILSQAREGQPVVVVPDDVAYIQFSSGSTGTPKGVVLTHRNLIANTIDIASRSEITARDRALSWMPLTHDMGLICFHLTCLASGINQYLMPIALFIRRPVLWIEKAHEYSITQLYSPNFGYRYFLNALDTHGGRSWDLSSVRVIYNGAEPISIGLCREFVETLSAYGLNQEVMYPGYGLAEASVAVCLPKPGTPLRSYSLHRDQLNVGDSIHVLPDNDTKGVSFVQTGFPIDHCRVRIAGDTDQVYKEGVIGHIQIKGDNVTAGYYRNPDATSKLFTTDHWLRTGDLGFMLNGQLVITGRAKNIIIVNGQNIYPQDIERVAQQVEGIAEGTVVAAGVPNPETSTDELIVFIYHKQKLEDFIPKIEAVRRHVLRATGLIVDKVIPVPKIPKTTSGKIQVFRLTRQYADGEYNAIIDRIEALTSSTSGAKHGLTDQLQAIWKALFAFDIQVDENLIAYGLNSLKAMQFISRIHTVTGTAVTVRNIFSHPTINKLAAFIDLSHKQEAVSVVPAEVQDHYPVTDGQKRFWILGQLENGHAAYVIPMAFDLRGLIDITGLERAFLEMISKYEILRTAFELVDGDLRQRVYDAPQVQFSITCFDQPDVQGQNQSSDLLHQQLTKEFSFNRAPLFRAILVRRAHDRATLLFSIHHIITDGWSLGIFFRELFQRYDRIISHSTLHETKPTHQYKDFVIFRERMLSARQLDSQKAYWLGELQDVARLQLPYAHGKRTAVASMTGKSVVRQFSKDLSAKLTALSAKEEGTLFMTLMAILNILFSRYCNQRDVVIGTNVSGRSHETFENQLGYFLNTVAIRNEVDDTSSFSSLYKAVKKKVLNAFENQDYSFDLLVKELGLDQEVDTTPIFNVLVLLQNFDHQLQYVSKSSKWTISPIDVPSENSFIDLHFEFTEREEVLALKVVYKVDLFQHDQVEALVNAFERIAEYFAEHREACISDVRYLTIQEEQNILALSEGSVRDYGDASILSEFHARVEEFPDHVAVVAGDVNLTYRTLDEHATNLAVYLRTECSLRPHDRVAVSMVRDERLIVAILAILKAGCVYVPIDPEFPTARVSHIVTESGAALMLTSGGVVDLKSVPVLKLDLPLKDLRNGKISGANRTQTSGQLAYIIYTSGSTGMPKGIMIGLPALTDYVLTFRRYFSVIHTDRMLCQSSISFDTSFEEILPVLCAGGKLVMAKEGGRDVEAMTDVIRREQVSIISTPPLVLNELNKEADNLRSLRLAISGGDVLQKSYIDRLLKVVPVYNTYGPSETTVCAAYSKVSSLEESHLIGLPIANRRIYVLNEKLALQPEGVCGEIFIGGKGLAEGYLKNVDLTKEKFIDDPFYPGQRLYRTGDLGRWLPGGKLEFLGRKDVQVKVRGYRVEPGEVESALMQNENVSKAVVVLDKAHGEGRLVAYLQGRKIGGSEMHVFLSSLVPSHCIPSHFVWLENFPVTSAGKIDRVALSKLKPDYHAVSEYVAPRTSVEVQLSSIWKEVLLREEVGIHDNFYSLGGHSLKAAQIVARIRRDLGRNVNISFLFSHPTIEQLAPLVEKAEGTGTSQVLASSRQDYYPLSPAQKRLWVLNNFDGGQSPYHVSVAFRLTGILDISLLEKAFVAVIRRHEILRTSFVNILDDAYQVIRDVEAINFSIGVDVVEEEQIGAWLEKKQDHLFDLGKDMLMRVNIARIEEQRYILLLTMHHIITDAWSVERMFREVSVFYRALLNATAPDLPPLQMQFKDYAVTQHALPATARFAESRKYWLETLSGEVPTLDLPLDAARPAIKTFNGKVIYHSIGKELKTQLLDYSQANEVTIFMTMLTGLCTLLYRYSGQQDIVIGTAMSGRKSTELEHQLGFYVNTVVLRSRFNHDESFRNLLGKVKGTVLDAYHHQDYPFERLIDELKIRRDLSRSPVFDVMVNFRDARTGEDAHSLFPGVTASPYLLERKASQFDVSVDFILNSNDVTIALEYNEDLFASERMERMVRHLETLLANATSGHDSLGVSKLRYLTDEEISQLHAFNPPRIAFDKDATIVTLFDAQVARKPDAVAIQYEDISLTYQSVNELAAFAGTYLVDRFKVKSGDVIAVMLPRNAWAPVWMLGIWKVGAIYLPVDPESPADRISWMIDDSGAALLLHADETKCSLPQNLSIRVVNVTEIGDIRQGRAWEADQRLNAHDPAYIIYTSGSTGRPKGVVVTHQNVVSVTACWREAYALDNFNVRLLQLANFFFDVFIGDVGRTLLTGGTMIICPTETRLNIPDLYQLMFRQRINILESTPALMMELASHIVRHGLISDFLKIVIVGSDVCSVADYKRLLHCFEGTARVINSYGTTETTIDSSFFEATNGSMIQSRSMPIGKPLRNTEFYILDSNRELLPPGVDGELYIGGAGVSGGYWNNEVLTNQKFIGDLGARLYRTGDLARWLPDGNVELVGRSDNQIKVRGFRVELDEIENAISEFPGIDAVAVVEKSKNVIVAYCKTHQEVEVESLRNYLECQLPHYMVPARFSLVEQLPLTPNGKIDRKTLRAINDTEEPVAGTMPRNVTEEVLMEIWKTVLKKEVFGVTDNFFELGGHSFSAMRAIYLIESKCGMKILLKDFFSNPTIESLAIMISGGETRHEAGIQPVERQRHYDLSSGQYRMWILEQGSDLEGAYHMPAAFRLTGEPAINALQNALDGVVERHEILRTVFGLVDGVVKQRVLPPTSFPILYIDLCNDEDRVKKSKQVMQEIFSSRFDLENGPLIRIGLIRESFDQYILAICLHHIIADGWSVNILATEIIDRYNSLVQKEESALPALRIQYKDYAAWQRGMSSNDTSKHYWKDQFRDGIPVLELPTDKKRPARRSYRGASGSIFLDEKIMSLLRQKSEMTGSTVFMSLLASVNTLLFKYSGQTDFVVGVPVAGRDQSELENQIGFYVNTLPIRTRFSADDSFRALVGKVRSVVVDSFLHQQFPFDQIVDALDIRQDQSRSPIFDVMVVLQSDDYTRQGIKAMCGVSVEEMSLPVTTSKFDLVFNFIATANDAYTLQLDFNTDLFEPATVERLLAHYLCLLQQLVTYVDEPLHTLRYTTSAEQEFLATVCRGVSRKYADDNIIAAFERSVQQHGGRTALLFADAKWTYDELNAESNRLARYLRDVCGAQSGDTVGVMIDRSAALVIAILGVLKAGCNYLPVDAAFPVERKRFMLDDAGSKLLVVDTTAPVVLDWQGQVVNLTLAKERLLSLSGENVGLEVKGSDVAYVLYTSGTTGRPKGVRMEHRSVRNLLGWLSAEIYEGKGPQVSMLTASVTFDASVQQLFTPLINGSALVMISEEVRRDPVLYLTALRRYGVDVLDITPSYLSVVLGMIAEEGEKYGVRSTLVGGEALSEELVSLYHSVCQGGSRLINVYGVTEAAVDSTYEVVGSDYEGGSIIGKPIANTTVYVLDAYHEVCGVGVWGELWIGGVGVGREYVNLPDTTAERFRSDVLTSGERLYRTGDRCRWRADGRLEFGGRYDHQVKVHGYRIELGEIERVMEEHSAVEQSVVLYRDHQLVGYYRGEASAEEVRDHMLKHLPGYMVPDHLMRQTVFPLTVSGKVDRNMLPPPVRDERQKEIAMTALESSLVSIWKDVLGVDDIGTHDDFFTLGGHSIKAMRVVTRIRQDLRLKIDLKTVLQHSTIYDLARALSMDHVDDEYHISPVEEQDYYRTSAAQKNIWLGEKLTGNPALYQITAAYEITGDFRKDLFDAAVQKLIRKHESLRTTILDIDGEPVQRITPSEYFGFQVQYGVFSGDVRSAVANAFDLHQAFNLEKGPLFRISILQGDNNIRIAVFCIHHIIFDGWSSKVFLDDIFKAYNGADIGELKVQYKDFASRENHQVDHGAYVEHARYWLNAWKNSPPPLNLVPVERRPVVKTYHGNNVTLPLSGEQVTALYGVCRYFNATPFTILVSLANAILFRYADSTDIILGCPVDGRDHFLLENQIGLYVNTIPVRTRFQNTDRFNVLVNAVRQSTMEAFAHRDYPFHKLVELLDIKRDPARSPLFDIMVAFQDEGDATRAFNQCSLQFTPIDLGSPQSKYDLVITLIRNEHWWVDITYNTDLFNEEFIRIFSSRFFNILKAVFERPDLRLREIPMSGLQDDLEAEEAMNALFDFQF